MDAVLANVFLKILNLSITAAYVMLFVCILRLFLKKMPKIISYALWSIVLFRLVCPVSFPSAYSLLNAFKRWDIPASPSGLAFVPDNVRSLIQTQSTLPTVTGTLTENLPAVAVPAPDISWIVFAAAALWLVGTVAMLTYSVVSYVRLSKRLTDATRIQGQVFESDRFTSPFIFGFSKPKIILPVGLAADDTAYVLCHELTHIRRRDYLVKPFAFLVLAVHWFNPFIWLSYFLMSQDMEMSCDERVMKDLGLDARPAYSNALLRLSLHRRILAGSPLAFGESGTKSRVKNILNYKKPVFWITVAVVAAALAVSISLLANPQNSGHGYKPTSEAVLPEGVSVEPQFASYPVGTNEIKLIIENETGLNLTFGSRYAVEKYNPDKEQWYQVPFVKNAAFDGLLHNLHANGTAEFFIYLNMLKEKLSEGEYRVWLLDDRITCEFELSDDPAASTDALQGEVTIVSWSDGRAVQGKVINEDYLVQIVKDAIMEHSLQSTIHHGISRWEMGDFISIQLKDREKYPVNYYIYNRDGQNYIQAGLIPGMCSKIDAKTYEKLIFTVMGYDGMIGLDGLPLSYTLTVQSGENSCLAMTHKITSYDKKSKLTDSMAPVSPQAVAGELQWLEIDFASEKDRPFTPYVNGLEVYGKYTLYDSNFREVPYFLPSGLKPQTYLFQNAEPGQYIVELETSFESDDSTFTCQYFFGVTIPETNPDGSATTATSTSGTEADPVTGYLFVIDYLATEENLGRRSLKYLAVDTTQMVGLSETDKERFLSGLGKYNLQVLDKTTDELIAEGYMSSAGGSFEDGALIIFDKIYIRRTTMNMDAYISFDGLDGFGMLDFDITYIGSSWSVTRTDITVIS